MRLTHALFDGDDFLGEVRPDELNAWPAASLVALPGDYWNPDRRWRWEGRSLVEDAAAVDAELRAAIDAERDRREAGVLTAGAAMQLVYARKAAEVDAWHEIGGTAVALAALPPAVRQRRFRFAVAEAARRGRTVPQVLAAFEAGLAASMAEAARVEAIAQDAIARLAAAPTLAAKRAVVAAIDWEAGR